MYHIWSIEFLTETKTGGSREKKAWERLTETEGVSEGERDERNSGTNEERQSRGEATEG